MSNRRVQPDPEWGCASDTFVINCGLEEARTTDADGEEIVPGFEVPIGRSQVTCEICGAELALRVERDKGLLTNAADLPPELREQLWNKLTGYGRVFLLTLVLLGIAFVGIGWALIAILNDMGIELAPGLLVFDGAFPNIACGIVGLLCGFIGIQLLAVVWTASRAKRGGKLRDDVLYVLGRSVLDDSIDKHPDARTIIRGLGVANVADGKPPHAVRVREALGRPALSGYFLMQAQRIPSNAIDLFGLKPRNP